MTRLSVIAGVLSIYLVLTLTNVDAEIVSDLQSSLCNVFFYKKSVPTGIPAQDPKSICQIYKSNNQYTYQFATYYDKSRKIPVYSAYTLPVLKKDCPDDQKLDRPSSWNVDCPLAGLKPAWQTTKGRCEGETRAKRKVFIKASQATEDDYTNSGYDKGHLNPNAHQCGVRRLATFTLTNAVPQQSMFNSQSWYENVEEGIQCLMRFQCNFHGAKRYVITGAVPGSQTIGNNVNVPSYMWSAVCCDASDVIGKNTFFYGFIGKNVANGKVVEYPDEGLFSQQLKVLYSSNQSIKLFGNGGCRG